MNQRHNQDDPPAERRPAEGVRIIGADEAQAALEAGQVAGRRSEDELRFGDVPPVPQGPRSPHRFPLPDSVDPAEAVPRPPLAASARPEEHRTTGPRLGTRINLAQAHDPRPWHERVPSPAPAEPVATEPEMGDPAAAADPEPVESDPATGDPVAAAVPEPVASEPETGDPAAAAYPIPAHPMPAEPAPAEPAGG
ncbi:MAG: hypothetical protein ACYC1D_19065, partial [Acidimicrobiales bacterium]